MQNIYVYDTEATGVHTRFDRPFQFAACTYDSDGNRLRVTNLRGRLPRYVLPDPEALLVTGQTISRIQSSSLSHYEFIGRVHADILANAPSVVMTFNGLSYDEELLRHSFFGNLRAPYVTQTHGSERVDLLVMARAIAALSPGSFTVPRGSDGKPSFKLEALSSANRTGRYNAHDALGDVQATMNLAIRIWNSAPKAWDLCARNRRKREVLFMLKAREPLVQVSWDYDAGTPLIRSILPIMADRTDPNSWLCVVLGNDADRVLQMDVATLAEQLSNKGRNPVLVRVKANTTPMVFHRATVENLVSIPLLDTRLIDRVSVDAAFAFRLAAAADRVRSSFGPPEHVCEQLYSGGFFPTLTDRPALDAFHKGSPAEKWERIADLKDPRARHLARWMVCSEWPQVIPVRERREIQKEFADHLLRDEAPWTTIPSALRKIDELENDLAGPRRAALAEYRHYLLNRQDAAVDQAGMVRG
ncbi:hypothetical protein [Pararhodobacter sp. CCB-MM2]|uniref:hypothetical protein n=1 Tax=Pararhodobacter sp. CCB-MM2 TaxID=1786003 RepID=UPI0008353DC1|nr:hypothetical protein [Pararhodobacter sp. CCB-MM2]